MWKKIRITLLLALAALVVIQFISIDKTNPELSPESDFITVMNPPPGIASTMRQACYDCHSHETEYPWYTNIQPAAWWVKGHIKEGRRNLNFSVWATYDSDRASHKIEEMIEEVEERHMPLKSYTWMHPEAKLSREQINEMVDWLKSI